jgi:hypothetical protein
MNVGDIITNNIMANKKLTATLFISNIYLEVTGWYIPEEPTEWYDDNMSGNPGYRADFEVESVKVEEIDILTIISDEVYEQIINEILIQQES